MKKLLLSLIFLAGTAFAGSYTSRAGLYKPVDGDRDWGTHGIRDSFDIIDSSFGILHATQTWTATQTFSGDQSFSGEATFSCLGSNCFSVSGQADHFDNINLNDGSNVVLENVFGNGQGYIRNNGASGENKLLLEAQDGISIQSALGSVSISTISNTVIRGATTGSYSLLVGTSSSLSGTDYHLSVSTMGVVSINGSGEGQIAITIGPSTFTVTSTSSSVLPNQIAVFNSTNSTLSGSSSFAWSGSSFTALGPALTSTHTILSGGATSSNNTAAPLDVFTNATAGGGTRIATFGSNQAVNQFTIIDQQPVRAQTYGGRFGNINVGLNSFSDKLTSVNAVTQFFYLWNSGQMELQTANSPGGGTATNGILLKPNQTTILTVTTSTVRMDTYGQMFSRSVAQFGAVTPDAVGQFAYCNNCSALTMCVSTGTQQGAWASPVNKGTACN